MNLLLLIGIALFFGTLFGKISQKLKIPQVVGFIIFGIIVGRSFLPIFEGSVVEDFSPLINLTLGIIGCVIGSELKAGIFRKYGKSIYMILLWEGLLAFVGVTVLVTLVTQKLYLGLILGAIASATDPALTMNVLWEYRSRGPLTTTITSIVALDDALALIIYGLVSVFATSMFLHQSFSIWASLAMPLFEIVKCLSIGFIFGWIAVKILKHLRDDTTVLAYLLGVIATVVGLSIYLHLDLILSTIVLGATIANLVPKISERYSEILRKNTGSFYILFFVVIGAQLDIRIFAQSSIAAIVLIYLLGFSFGKVYGAKIGAILSRAKPEVIRYCGPSLLAQGGVAMGLALSISQKISPLGP